MIWYEAAWEWAKLNTDAVVIVGVVLLVFSIGKISTYLKKKKAEEKFEHYPYNGNHELPAPTFDDINFDKDILESEFMEKNNINHLITERNHLVEEIDKRKLEYVKAKDHREKSLLVMKRLAKHIPQLANQYKALDAEIKELEKNK